MAQDYNPDDPVNIITKAAYDHNIVVVFAAGNSGGPNMLGSNSVSPYVICVGAVDKSFKKASFSSTGRPGGDMTRDANGLYRPTIMAPGVDIIAAALVDGRRDGRRHRHHNPFYTHSDGTSMATPHVAGAVALMLQARPQLTPQNVIDIIEGTAAQPARLRALAGRRRACSMPTPQCARPRRVRPPSAHRPTARRAVYTLLSSKDWNGQVLPAGYSVIGQTTALASDTKVTVGTGVDALYAEIEWVEPQRERLSAAAQPGRSGGRGVGRPDRHRLRQLPHRRHDEARRRDVDRPCHRTRQRDHRLPRLLGSVRPQQDRPRRRRRPARPRRRRFSGTVADLGRRRL